jgi:WD40 repeat protein
MGSGEALWAQFSQDGKWFATAGTDGTVVLRDPETFVAVKTLVGDGRTGGTGNAFAFSDDSRYLLTSLDGRARLWDVATGEPIGGAIADDCGTDGCNPYAVPGEIVRYATTSDRWHEFWEFDVDRWHDIACHAAGRNMTAAEWEQYGPRGEPYHATCPQWAGV